MQIANILSSYIETIKNLQFTNEKIPVLKDMYKMVLQEKEFVMKYDKFRQILLTKTYEFLETVDDNEFKNLACQVLTNYTFASIDEGLDDDHEIGCYDHAEEI